MKGFVVEYIGNDGNVSQVASFETQQSLLNDSDLNVVSFFAKHGYCYKEPVNLFECFMASEKVENVKCMMVREKYDTTHAYYLKGGEWAYDITDNVINYIKRQL